MVDEKHGLEFPSRADGETAFDAGYVAGLAGQAKEPPHRHDAGFTESCLRSCWLNGYHRGRQQAVQDIYGDPITAT